MPGCDQDLAYQVSLATIIIKYCNSHFIYTCRARMRLIVSANLPRIAQGYTE